VIVAVVLVLLVVLLAARSRRARRVRRAAIAGGQGMNALSMLDPSAARWPGHRTMGRKRRTLRRGVL
jgi:hypothetical protein